MLCPHAISSPPRKRTLKPVSGSPHCQDPVSAMYMTLNPPASLDSTEEQDPGLRRPRPAAIVDSKGSDTGKSILPWFVQPLEHPSGEVVAHEGLGELSREAVLRIAQRPAILSKVIPNIGQHHREGVLTGFLHLNSTNTKVFLGR